MSEHEEEPKRFDPEKAKIRSDQINRILKAHDIPCDAETAMVLFVEGIRRAVNHFGPLHMAFFASTFVDTWRGAEGSIVKGILLETIIEQIAEASAGETKH